MGADGIIGGAHNIAPKIGVMLYEAAAAGNYELALELSRTIGKICEIFQYGEIWGGFEAALRLLDICEKAVFAPYRSATAEEEAKVRAILEGCGLLQAGNSARG